MLYVIPSITQFNVPDYPITQLPDYAMLDLLIVGAGPAGAIAGIVLARAGARVRLIDRSTFPRDKLCGDTINPGTLARAATARRRRRDRARRAARSTGWCVTGERGVGDRGAVSRRVDGRAILRRDLDWLLLQEAVAAACQFEPGVAVRGSWSKSVTAGAR